MKTLVAILLAWTLSLSGCAGLILRDDDGAMETTGKVTARLLLGLATLGSSEAWLASTEEAELERKILALETKLYFLYLDGITDVLRSGHYARPAGVELLAEYRQKLEELSRRFDGKRPERPVDSSWFPECPEYYEPEPPVYRA